MGRALAAVGFLIFGGRLMITLSKVTWSPGEATDAISVLVRFTFDLVFLMSGLFLLLFSVRLNKALSVYDQQSLLKAFGSLKSLFKLTGVLGVTMVISFVLWQLLIENTFLS